MTPLLPFDPIADAPVAQQLVGAFGERAVEAELLRRGWLTANVNASVRNARDFDLFATKKTRSLQIRVKTCSPGQDVQFNTARGREIILDEIADTDFTVVVRIGASRDRDQFYIVPTKIVRTALSVHRTNALRTQQDRGHWVLRWREHRSDEEKPNYGFERKWALYLDAWGRLDGAA
jgi:hypothetical protein